MMWIVLITLLLRTMQSGAFSVGPPPTPTVCRSMTPQHHHYTPQGSDPPYTISVNRNEISQGSNVKVTLSTTEEGVKLKGFYIQGRDDNDKPVGSFSANRLTKVHSCFGKRANAAHHANNKVKKNVTISWTAPKDFEGEVVFSGTAMQNFVSYWVFLQSDPVIVLKAKVSSAEKKGRTYSHDQPFHYSNSKAIFLNSVTDLFQSVVEGSAKIAQRFFNIFGRQLSSRKNNDWTDEPEDNYY